MNARTVFVAAPLLTFTYGVIRILDGLDGVRGPGLAWTTGHLIFMAALVAFQLVFVHLWRLAGRDTLATATVVIATVGTLCLFVQFGIDIVNGLLAEDHAAMSEFGRGLKSNTFVSLAVYDVGPYLFYFGQFVLVARLALLRRIPAWTAALLVVDLVMPLVSKDLIPVGAAALMVSFVSIAKRIQREPARV
ncbi:hypothetical protein [Actinophytocola oryzae]|uniref:Low temperature requirement A protein (LtrA) n=1 Tax=Actinophytocola oryzae TaxID=502181 RepID=A0A4R7VCU0_9PSEU|nr:hypothetical protein [Actinophytocola oryzae]TDV46825.1 hypothetical protein CLV71_1104 [Actinophytocola oryzae]